MTATGYAIPVPEESLPSPGRCSTMRNLARAAFTVPPFLLQHLWRRRRIEDSTRAVARLSEPPPVPVGHDDRSVDLREQVAADGIGPLVLRSYEVRIIAATSSPDELIDRLIRRPTELNDHRIAGFVRDDRTATDLVAGDELVVELPGPWNGPVRVDRADAGQLLLQTLDGHMEAGQIRFDVCAATERTDGKHDYTFRIRSWARGGDTTFTLLHLGLRVAKELQTAMWVAMCEGAIRVSRGERDGPIMVTTEVLDDSTPDGDRLGDTLASVGGN